MKWLVTAALLLFLFELSVAHKFRPGVNSRETPASRAPEQVKVK